MVWCLHKTHVARTPVEDPEHLGRVKMPWTVEMEKREVPSRVTGHRAATRPNLRAGEILQARLCWPIRGQDGWGRQWGWR